MHAALALVSLATGETDKGELAHLEMVESESTFSYMPATRSYIERHGKPVARPPFDPRDLHRPLAHLDDLTATKVWREERSVTASLTLQYNKAMFILEPTEISRKLARKRVSVCEYPDGRIEIRHGPHVLAYRVFDKMRQVNQAAVIDNKHLNAALMMARAFQELAPHHRNRNNNEPSRPSSSNSIFAQGQSEGAGKVDGRRIGRPKLKKLPQRLSAAELEARGTAQFVTR